MFGTKTKPKTLGSILSSFRTAKEDLEELVETEKLNQEMLEQELESTKQDIKKGTHTISKLADILGD